ncbi:MAG: DUF58 domain-containing protein [Acidobacteria bacterium]|nr:DUF58 domain-containing protein [Acidobacteriota bacterium]
MIDLTRLERLARRLDLRLGRRGGRPEPGERRVAVRGRGLTFAGHREYQPGDDVRDIDWNVTARAGRPFVKVHQQEMAGVVVVAVDVSGSMIAGPTGSAKRAAALDVAALFLLAAAGTDERIGAIAFTDRIERYFTPQRGRRHALRLVHALDGVHSASRATALGPVLQALDHVLRLPAVVILVSDFADDGYDRALARLSVRHDIVGVAVGDPRERELPSRRLARVEDVETGATRWLDTSNVRVRDAWAARWRAIDDARRRAFRSVGAPLVDVDTRQPWLEALLARQVATRSELAR